MPWKETEPMNERMKLIADSMDGHFRVTELSDGVFEICSGKHSIGVITRLLGKVEPMFFLSFRVKPGMTT